jgi:hypothetical protein
MWSDYLHKKLAGEIGLLCLTSLASPYEMCPTKPPAELSTSKHVSVGSLAPASGRAAVPAVVRRFEAQKSSSYSMYSSRQLPSVHIGQTCTNMVSGVRVPGDSVELRQPDGTAITEIFPKPWAISVVSYDGPTIARPFQWMAILGLVDPGWLCGTGGEHRRVVPVYTDVGMAGHGSGCGCSTRTTHTAGFLVGQWRNFSHAVHVVSR